MTNPVAIQNYDGIAVLLVDNPPVNALAKSVRQGLRDGMREILDDPAYVAAVIACAGRTFVSGADIHEFDLPMEGVGIDEINTLFENRSKPVIAAIHGVALGGGLEIAMGCHFRIATKDAKLGQPEVKLGLIPGGGGTQRLPRAIGPARAVELIVSGEPILAVEGLKLGLIDEIFEGDPIAAGVAFARRVLSESRAFRSLRDDDSKLASTRADRNLLTEAVNNAVKRDSGMDAPRACVEAIGWSLNVPFDEAIRRERELFLALKDGEQSKALRHVFFAERNSSKVASITSHVRPRAVNTVAVIGAGTMGGGIAQSFANAGIPVRLVEVTEEALDKGLATIRKGYDSTVARGGLSAEEAARRAGLISGAVGLERVEDADLIVEAVFETMQIKEDVFSRLSSIAKPGAILATNTSYLDVNVIAAATYRAQDVVGLHFFSPANIMRLCEIVRGKETAPDVLATAIAVARRIAKVPVVVGVCHGFVGNRMLSVSIAQARKLLLEGALPQQIDAVANKFGMMGPFAMGDLAGLDIGWRSRKDSGERLPIEDALCEAGRFGQKSGAGFYRYNQGSRTPIPDPEVEALIVETSRGLNIGRRDIEDAEIHERLTYPMINEGARILEEGIVERASDIDLVWLYGYGWPRQTGGPMFWADQTGLAIVANRLAYMAAIDRDTTLRPAPRLARLAFGGGTFGSLK
ncbi:3-hydroxyacyl-CoA dehydrogenase NAD-binding domain-containing protein [Bradyrhizobium pachyrhizi]|uniref:3-hydroxyacyl-CoA dehydrogenase NAD-binding domain-containing protein n=1 Tax=Bradyrhizobium pachyrhizi TaxID=280333 RepID=UPI00067D4655|nr:3-hydroxyacyl-CoA dehydrogenase NAD-binding domain-containing protein [Bradyrhizobium pachyrhizi]